MRMTKAEQTLASLENRGFDNCTIDGRHVRIGCTQCSAIAINGTAVHERTCPNETHTCKGCETQIPMRAKYCEDCQ